VIDVLNTPGAREVLTERTGLRRVPVLVKGDQYAFGQMLEPFAKMVGLNATGSGGLSPTQLFEKYKMVFAAGQRYARQFPPERFRERVIPNRERVIRTLCYHIFRIGEAFLETWDGAEYGASVWERYENWWKGVDDRSLPRVLKTYYGDTKAPQVFERVTWHSAQHCRQLIAVLERMGIKPDRPLTAEDLKGLPLPERLWE